MLCLRTLLISLRSIRSWRLHEPRRIIYCIVRNILAYGKLFYYDTSMTRVNLVHPTELHRKHLQGEYHELGRVFFAARAAWNRRDTRALPPEYTLGTGHMRFFYDKQVFLHWRHVLLVKELQRRGYKPNFLTPPSLLGMPMAWLNDYTPTAEAMALSRNRLILKMPDSPF